MIYPLASSTFLLGLNLRSGKISVIQWLERRPHISSLTWAIGKGSYSLRAPKNRTDHHPSGHESMAKNSESKNFMNIHEHPHISTGKLLGDMNRKTARFKVMFQFLPDIYHTLWILYPGDGKSMQNVAGDLCRKLHAVSGSGFEIPLSRAASGFAFPRLQVGFVVRHLAHLVSVVGTLLSRG